MSPQPFHTVMNVKVCFMNPVQMTPPLGHFPDSTTWHENVTGHKEGGEGHFWQRDQALPRSGLCKDIACSREYNTVAMGGAVGGAGGGAAVLGPGWGGP